MFFILYTIYRYIYCLRHHLKFTEQEDPWLCFKYYKQCTAQNKKSLWRVLFDVERLLWYWHRFPDTYFIFCHWLEEYDNYKQIKSFLPQRNYGLACQWGGKISSTYDIVINDKILFHELMSYYGIPVPEMILIYKNQHFIKDNVILNEERVNELLKSHEGEKIYVKLPSAGAARGVFVMIRENGVWLMDGKEVNATMLKERFGSNDMFMESGLLQEPVLRKFNPDTINTIRILTKNKDAKIDIVSAAVRFGRKGQYVDNMHAGGLAASVNIETGKIESYAGRRFDPTKYEEHPDSHLRFEGVQIPQWDEIKQLVYKALLLLPPYFSVGFDIVTTEKGPLILEINTGAGMDLAQVGKGWGIADSFYPMNSK